MGLPSGRLGLSLGLCLPTDSPSGFDFETILGASDSLMGLLLGHVRDLQVYFGDDLLIFRFSFRVSFGCDFVFAFPAPSGPAGPSIMVAGRLRDIFGTFGSVYGFALGFAFGTPEGLSGSPSKISGLLSVLLSEHRRIFLRGCLRDTFGTMRFAYEIFSFVLKNLSDLRVILSCLISGLASGYLSDLRDLRFCLREAYGTFGVSSEHLRDFWFYLRAVWVCLQDFVCLRILPRVLILRQF